MSARETAERQDKWVGVGWGWGQLVRLASLEVSYPSSACNCSPLAPTITESGICQGIIRFVHMSGFLANPHRNPFASELRRGGGGGGSGRRGGAQTPAPPPQRRGGKKKGRRR